jgi:DNA-binding phage protein
MNGNLGNSALALALQNALQASTAEAQSPFMPAGGGSSLSSQLPQLIQSATQAVAAQQSAQNMSQMAQTAGVGQGPIMGLLSRLGQTLTGGPASYINPALNTQENSAAKALAAAGVNPGTMPTVTQSQSTATQAMAGIQRLLQSLGGAGVAPSSTGALPLPAQ